MRVIDRILMRCLCFRLAAVLLVGVLSGCHLNQRPAPSPAVPPAGSASKPFDLLWQGKDLNGLPEDAKWGTQASDPAALPPPAQPSECVRQPNLPACTDQIPPNPPPGTIDLPVDPNLAICSLDPAAKIHGHVNWTPAEYSGRAAWVGLAIDDDYNFALIPHDFQGLTKASPDLGAAGTQYIEPEFDAAETADNFATPWWQNFRDTVESFDDVAVQRLITPPSGNLPQAVVVGLMGLDCEHDCHSEIHPVYGIAIEINDTPDDNTWVMFVRNWGDEGFCSVFDHQIGFAADKITLLLPRQSSGSFSVDSNQTQFHASSSTTKFPAITHVAGAGTAVTFQLPPAQKHGLAELVLHLKWTNDTYSGGPNPAKVNEASQLRAQATNEKSAMEAEKYMQRMYRAKAPGVPRPSPTTKRPVPVHPGVAPGAMKVTEATPDQMKPSAQTPMMTMGVASGKIQRDCEMMRKVCSSYNNNPPSDVVANFPQLCQEMQKPSACSDAARQAKAKVQSK